jgi:hypothetical protein
MTMKRATAAAAGNAADGDVEGLVVRKGGRSGLRSRLREQGRLLSPYVSRIVGVSESEDTANELDGEDDDDGGNEALKPAEVRQLWTRSCRTPRHT